MSAILPVNVESLLRKRTVESERIEFKGAWDTHRTGPQVIRTICAFANDLHNLNGGYIVIGVDEEDGRCVLPVRGLAAATIDEAQKWIRGECYRLDPLYQPVLSPEPVDGKLILVVWVPASDVRPHRAPGRGAERTPSYWVRLGAETVDAQKRGLLNSLIEQTAKVPWDDRRAADAQLEHIREAKVREYLRDVESGLVATEDERDVYRRLRITTRVNDHEVPRNVGLLLFSNDPEQWIRGARIEVVQFAGDRGGNVQEERTFTGPLLDQVVDCLKYLENLSTHHLQKQRDRPRVRGWVSYPIPALREALVNAVYHRGYGPDQPDPTKVYLYPSRVVVTSYPGPVPGIDHYHLLAGATPPAVPARNRRIGEFLKDLGLAEGRLTGIPKIFDAMRANGSPEPRFEFDSERTFFEVTLPAHPEYAALSALRDALHLRTLGESDEAFRRVEAAWEANKASATLAAEVIRHRAASGDVGGAEDVYEAYATEGVPNALPHVRNTLIDALLDAGDHDRARAVLERHPPRELFGQDAIDAAILARRTRDARLAHQYFVRAGDAVQSDPRALLEFAQTKNYLAGDHQQAAASRARLRQEARALLERVVHMDTSPTRHAWAWRELGRTLDSLRMPWREVEAAYASAIDLLPQETRFRDELRELRAKRPS